MKIFEYIDLRESGISSRKTAELCAISRTTGEKYYRKFKENRTSLVANPTWENSQVLIEECLAPLSFDTSKQISRRYTPEEETLLNHIHENEKKLL